MSDTNKIVCKRCDQLEYVYTVPLYLLPASEKWQALCGDCFREVLQVEPDQVTMEARFGDDLDADSLDLVELVMALEENFDITVDESELEGVETVGQAFNLIASKL